MEGINQDIFSKNRKKKLIITDKPDLAKRLCKALKEEHFSEKQGYWESENFLVSWCNGHLVELAPPDAYDERWKKWGMENLPVIPENWRYVVKDYHGKQFQILKGLMTNQVTPISEILAATDSSREGELIFRLLYEMTGSQVPAKRIWFTSLDPEAIRDSMNHPKNPGLFDSLYYSAMARQKADWLIGINGTRLYTSLNPGKVLKIGRVLTPTLSLIAEREKEVEDAQTGREYRVCISILEGNAVGTHSMSHERSSRSKSNEQEWNQELKLYSKPFKSRGEASALLRACELKGTASILDIRTESYEEVSPRLHNLTSLQEAANEEYGYTAKQTSEYAQCLFEQGMITYPRTDCRYLTKKVANQLEALFSDKNGFQNKENVIDEAAVNGHHAIVPTLKILSVDLDALEEAQIKLYLLITNRMFEAFKPNTLTAVTKVTASCAGKEFATEIQNGNLLVPHFNKGQQISFRNSGKRQEKNQEKSQTGDSHNQRKPGTADYSVKLEIEEQELPVPTRFTDATLLYAMDHDSGREGLGTSTTRADIIEKLISEGYVKREERYLVPTEAGMELVELLPGILKSSNMTTEWEKELEQIEKGEKDADSFIEMIEGFVKDLVTFETAQAESERKRKTDHGQPLGKCPNCQTDVVSGKFGAYCPAKCGMRINRVLGSKLADGQVRSLLSGEKVYVKDLKNREGTTFGAWLTLEGVSPYSYHTNGKEFSGFEYKVRMEYPDRDNKHKNTGFNRRKERPQ